MRENYARGFVGFVLRAALIFAAGYALWIPLQPGFTALVAALTEPILSLIDDPPLVYALVAVDDSVEFYSYLTGFVEPMAAWSTETIGVFVLAPLVLVLAAPFVRWPVRLAAAAAVLALVVVTCTGIAVTQIQLAAAAHARGELGIRVLTESETATLTRFNDLLHVVGMLAGPAFVLLALYAPKNSLSR